MCLVGDIVGRLLALRDYVFEKKTLLVIDLHTFSQDLWMTIASDIIWSVAKGNGIAYWVVSETGVFCAQLQRVDAPAPTHGPDIVVSDVQIMGVDGAYVSSTLFMDCRLLHIGHDAVLIVTAHCEFAQNNLAHESLLHHRVLGVTPDGMSFASPRRYYDEEEEHNVVDVVKCGALQTLPADYKWKTMFKPSFFLSTDTKAAVVSCHTIHFQTNQLSKGFPLTAS